jgi:phenylpropionate dioxygenase-like ring-hydroxylating dioxygenase large terminal subunit
MSFLRNTWYVAMWDIDLAESAIVPRTILTEPIAFFRQPDGAIAAIADQCAHRFAPLSAGKICDDGKALECAYHGLQFNGEGECTKNPHGTGRIPAALRVKSYTVEVKHSIVWIWIGDEPADRSVIPDYSHLDEGAPGIVSKRDMMVIDVDYRLMADNLLDLSHANFLHDGILGNPERVDAEVDIREDDDGTLYVTRTSHNVPPGKLFDLMWHNDGAPVDSWAEMRWNAPGLLRNHAGITAPGAAREEGLTVIGNHLLTPIDERSCYYHIAAVRLCASASPADNDPDLAEKLSTMRHYAFSEQDRPMVEAQQRAYDRAGGPDALKPVMLTVDAGPLRGRRILQSRIDAEAARATALPTPTRRHLKPTRTSTATPANL